MKRTPGLYKHVAVEGGWDGVASEDGTLLCRLVLNNPANADLFAAAPKLADAHHKNIVAAAYDQDESAVKLAVRLSAIEAEARAALADAGLED